MALVLALALALGLAHLVHAKVKWASRCASLVVETLRAVPG